MAGKIEQAKGNKRGVTFKKLKFTQERNPDGTTEARVVLRKGHTAVMTIRNDRVVKFTSIIEHELKEVSDAEMSESMEDVLRRLRRKA